MIAKCRARAATVAVSRRGGACVAAASPVAHHGGVSLLNTIFRGWAVVGGLLAASACERLGPYTETETTGTETTGDTGSLAPEVCEAYVACLKEVDAAAGAEADESYGAKGRCWSEPQDTQAECLAICDAQLRSYAAAFPEIAACDAGVISTDVEFEIGEAVFDPVDQLLDPVYRSVKQGDTLTIVRGGQGLLMLPLGLRGRNFTITEDPNDWDNPKMPKVNLWVDIEDHNVGFGGHFARINNYAVGFVDKGDGLLEHMYIAVIVPDAIPDPTTLTGKPGKIHIELYTYNKPSAVRELDFVVAPKIQEY
jgi:hypothetical protein